MNGESANGTSWNWSGNDVACDPETWNESAFSPGSVAVETETCEKDGLSALAKINRRHACANYLIRHIKGRKSVFSVKYEDE